jgi:hypothetical protein
MSENNQPAPAAGSSVGWPAVATFLFSGQFFVVVFFINS